MATPIDEGAGLETGQNNMPKYPIVTVPNTASAFLAKFPDAEFNDNCMVDLGCPVCGNRVVLYIETRVTCRLTDNGSEDVYGDYETDENSMTRCPDCGFVSQCSRFTYAGLDTLIAAQFATAPADASSGSVLNPSHKQS
jgi:predicted RNA-binding Zn-ribbon protein involved in translation (DUF1610 family)